MGECVCCMCGGRRGSCVSGSDGRCVCVGACFAGVRRVLLEKRGKMIYKSRKRLCSA